MSHKYHVELDVIASAGVEGVARLASTDNTVYINRAEIETAARDPRNPNRYELVEFLRWKNELESNSRPEDITKRRIQTPSGGYVSWENPEKRIRLIYITGDEVRRSKLLGGGREVDFPAMLKFTTRPLESGIVKINSVGEGELSIRKVMDSTGLEELYPYQFVQVDGTGLLYAVRRRVVPTNNRKTRFKLDDNTGLEKQEVHKSNGIYRLPEAILNISAWNLEQRLAWEHLTSPDIELSFLTGGSGSGKTVLAYGAALQLILDTRRVHGNDVQIGPGRKYDGITLFKPNDIIGGENREFGFLKGDLAEKTRPLVKSYEDAHELSGAGEKGTTFEHMLMHPDHANDFSKDKRPADLNIAGHILPPHREAIKIEHLQFARGRTFTGQVIIIDEAQNYTPNEMKQLLERVGEGCKIIVLGDPMQVDGERFGLSPEFNGLVWAGHTHYGNHPRVSFMDLDKNYRSQTAEITRGKRAPRTLS